MYSGGARRRHSTEFGARGGFAKQGMTRAE